MYSLHQANVASIKEFAWLSEMRYYYNSPSSAPAPLSPSEAVTVRQSNAIFSYGFEYLGVVERLVQTPLTDRTYFTLTQALFSRLAGNPFGILFRDFSLFSIFILAIFRVVSLSHTGPAGTGKTQTVKSLGAQLGKKVIVFGCDESFDFQAMARIFVGLCHCGAWGCFDEFNRLEERILSAVSQQIQIIQVQNTTYDLLNVSFARSRSERRNP